MLGSWNFLIRWWVVLEPLTLLGSQVALWRQEVDITGDISGSHLKSEIYEPSGDNFLSNVHLKVPFLTLLIIVTRWVCEDGSFHSGLEPSQQLRSAYCSSISRTIITITSVVVGNCIRYKMVFPWLIICAAITRRAKLHYETITNVKAFIACASIA